MDLPASEIGEQNDRTQNRTHVLDLPPFDDAVFGGLGAGGTKEASAGGAVLVSKRWWKCPVQGVNVNSFPLEPLFIVKQKSVPGGYICPRYVAMLFDVTSGVLIPHFFWSSKKWKLGLSWHVWSMASIGLISPDGNMGQ